MLFPTCCILLWVLYFAPPVFPDRKDAGISKSFSVPKKCAFLVVSTFGSTLFVRRTLTLKVVFDGLIIHKLFYRPETDEFHSYTRSFHE